MCKKIQTCVDRYIKVGGTAFLFGHQEGSESNVIEMIQLPKKGFVILRKPLLSFSCGNITRSYYLHDNKSLVKHGDRRIQKMVYEAMQEIIVCYIYKSQKGLIYRYDLQKEN